MISIMAGNGAQLPYHDWGPKSAQPIIFRHGWPPNPAERPAAFSLRTGLRIPRAESARDQLTYVIS